MAITTYIQPLLDLESAVRSMLDIVDYGLLAWNEVGEILVWSAGVQLLTGYAWKDVANKDWLTILCPDPQDATPLRAAAEAVLSGRAEQSKFQFALRRKDGERRALSCMVMPLNDAASIRVGVWAAFKDLTESVVPIALHAQEPAGGISIDDQAAQIVFRIEPKTGKLLFVSGNVNSALGYSSRELCEDQRLLPSRILPDYFDGFEAAVSNAARGAARSVEVGMVHKDGQEVYFSTTVYPVKDTSGSVMTIEAVSRDISAQKSAEIELAKSLYELRRAYDQLTIQHEELKSVERLKSQIIANVSHELRTPLVTIRGYNELIRQGALGEISEAQQRGLEVSARSISRLLVLIENLLDYARLEREGLRIPDERVDMVEVLDTLIEESESELTRRQLTVSRDISRAALMVKGDRRRLCQAFRNIIDNAIKFSQDAGEIAVSCKKTKDGECLVSIDDQGIGIPESELDRIFDSFYQVDGSATRPYAGAGIGLAVAKEIVERHGGRIHVSSKAGSGAKFSVFMPLWMK
ncbi:MAG: PAS domain S-box protein [Deltaproteobacteria bacterium]|nr:PAS domain S-box protein [Deltaproteobacteria bacterium]